MNAFLRSILSSLLVISTLGLGSGLALADSTKVVYHIDDAANQGLKGLRNIRNHFKTTRRDTLDLRSRDHHELRTLNANYSRTASASTSD
jgi:hypothetical protein